VAAVLALLPGTAVRADDTLPRGGRLLVGQGLTSLNNQFQMKVEPDGSFAVFRVEGAPPAPGGPAAEPILVRQYQSTPSKAPSGLVSLVLQPDNNLTICDTAEGGMTDWLWQSGTSGKGPGPASLVLGDDGLLRLVCSGAPIWSSIELLGGSAPVPVPDPPVETKSAASPSSGSSDLPAPAGGARTLEVGGGRSKLTIQIGRGDGPEPRGLKLGGGRSAVYFKFGR